MVPPGDQPSRRLPPGARRQAILDSATESFIRRGYAGTRIRDVTARAGVTEGTLYRYFDSKDDLYHAAILGPLLTALGDLSTDVERIDRDVADPVDFLTAVTARALEFFSAYGRHQGVALCSGLESGRASYRTEIEPVLDRIGEVITARTGWATIGIGGRIARHSILGSLWAVGLAATDDSVPDAELVGRLSRMFTGGIRS